MLGGVLIAVVTDAQVLKHQAISMHCDYKISIILDQFYGQPDSKAHGANMGSIWGPQEPGGPHVGPITFAICAASVLPNILNGTVIQALAQCSIRHLILR